MYVLETANVVVVPAMAVVLKPSSTFTVDMFALTSRSTTEEAVAVVKSEVAIGTAEEPVVFAITEFAAMAPYEVVVEPVLEIVAVTAPVNEIAVPKVVVPVNVGDAIVGLVVSTTFPVPDDANHTGACAAEPVPKDSRKYAVAVVLPASLVNAPAVPP